MSVHNMHPNICARILPNIRAIIERMFDTFLGVCIEQQFTPGALWHRGWSPPSD